MAITDGREKPGSDRKIHITIDGREYTNIWVFERGKTRTLLFEWPARVPLLDEETMECLSIAHMQPVYTSERLVFIPALHILTLTSAYQTVYLGCRSVSLDGRTVSKVIVFE